MSRCGNSVTPAVGGGERRALLDQRPQDGERRDDRIAGRVPVEAERWPEFSPPSSQRCS